MPPKYATELQTVINTLNDLKQPRVEWDCGTAGIGVLVSDSLMFQRGEPTPSDPHLGNVYGLAMPLLKRGLPVTPGQLENLTVTNYLNGFRVLLLSYDGQKPLSADVHAPLADWSRQIAWGIHRARREGQILATTGAGPDHPVHPMLPESAYLKALLLQVD